MAAPGCTGPDHATRRPLESFVPTAGALFHIETNDFLEVAGVKFSLVQDGDGPASTGEDVGGGHRFEAGRTRLGHLQLAVLRQ